MNTGNSLLPSRRKLLLSAAGGLALAHGAGALAAPAQAQAQRVLGFWTLSFRGLWKAYSVELKTVEPDNRGAVWIGGETASGIESTSPFYALVGDKGGKLSLSFDAVPKGKAAGIDPATLRFEGEETEPGKFTGRAWMKDGVAHEAELTRVGRPQQRVWAGRIGRDTAVRVIYVSASDCGVCRVFGPGFLAEVEKAPWRSEVAVVNVNANSTTSIGAAKYWPDELKFVLDQQRFLGGTPRFVVTIEQEVVVSTWMGSAWTSTVRPITMAMAAEKRSA